MSDRKLLTTVLLAATLLFGGCIMVAESEYSTGYRDCVPQKLSESGIIWKTWEGEAALAGAKNVRDKNGIRTGSIPNLWMYTVRDSDVRKQLEELPSGSAVRLHYRQVLIGNRWNGGTDYRIVKVEKIPESAEK